jgi:hypothetical protein
MRMAADHIRRAAAGHIPEEREVAGHSLQEAVDHIRQEAGPLLEAVGHIRQEAGPLLEAVGHIPEGQEARPGRASFACPPVLPRSLL